MLLLKRKELNISNLNKGQFENVNDNFYQLSFDQNPAYEITIKDTTIETCKFNKIDFSRIKLINTHLVNCLFENFIT